MARKSKLSLKDLEQETKRFLSPASEKEQAIIDAAVELLGERGIDGTTTAEIARRAKTTERTLFRYFPSKDDLVKRVLFPLLLRVGVSRSWEEFASFLQSADMDLKGLFAAIEADRLGVVARNPGLARTVLVELVQNDALRDAVGALWRQHIWQPMTEGLAGMQAEGAIRREVDVEVLARAIHCLHVGYFLARYILAPGKGWDDASEIDKMAEILAFGSAPATAKR
jgi:AcrR family transcriptional regulator